MAPVIPRDYPREHIDGRMLRQRRVDPRQVFEVMVDRHYDRDSYRIRWRSQMFGLDRSLELRAQWAYYGHSSPQVLARFIEELVGRDLMNWAELGADGRRMGEVMAEHWDREIYRFMERIEREGQHDYLRPIGRNVTERIFFSEPKEDPEATKKARATLLRHLDPEQKSSFEKSAKFVVIGKDGKGYTITRARSFNVTAPDGTKYCGQLSECPLEDQMLAQKILLQNDPEKFFKNANVSPAAVTLTSNPRGDRNWFEQQYLNDPARW